MAIDRVIWEGQDPDRNPFAVDLLDERSCHWNEADVPLAERGVRFSWLRNFVMSIYWQRYQLAQDVKYWSGRKAKYFTEVPTYDELSIKWREINTRLKELGIRLDEPNAFYETTIHELVALYIVPLTKTIRAPLYALVPPSDRGKPEVFLSHAWANSVLSQSEMFLDGTLDAFDREGIAGIKEEFVWIDFACFNQHMLAPDTIAFDMEALIRSIGNVAFAVTTTPLFDRIWCLWEVLSVSQAGAKARFCVPPGYRTEKRQMVNKFFESFKSVKEARATKMGDYEKLLAAMISRFGSIAAADEYIRKLMRGGMGHPWFELYSENR